MKELESIKIIDEIGLTRFVERYNLRVKEDDGKILLKYDQLNSPDNIEAVNECRGLILRKDTFEVVSYPFKRFSNYNESSRKTVNWDKARYFEKTDGTLIQYYFDWKLKKWFVGTTGTISANKDNISSKSVKHESRTDYNMTFEDLFLNTCKELGVKLSKCIPSVTYIFELACKENIVVNEYSQNRVVLLGGRFNDSAINSYQELGADFLNKIAEDRLCCERPKEYFFENEKQMLESLEKVKFGDINFEGYVVLDESDKTNIKRLKVKSNTYLVFSQFNGREITSKYRLVDIVLNGEVEEVSSVLPQLRDELMSLKNKISNWKVKLKPTFEELRTEMDDKQFFIKAQTSLDFNKTNKPLMMIYNKLKEDRNLDFDESFKYIITKKLYKILK